jgi:hypothetical protein
MDWASFWVLLSQTHPVTLAVARRMVHHNQVHFLPQWDAEQDLFLVFVKRFCKKTVCARLRRKAANQGCQIFSGATYQNGEKCTK